MDPSIIIALLGLAGSLFGGVSQAGAQREAGAQTQEQWEEWMRLLQQEPSVGYFPTLTTEQQSILQQLTGQAGGGLGGILGGFTDISPEAETAAIEKLTAPAEAKFYEEILPGIRGKHAQAETMWSTMRAGEEVKGGATLATQLAAMGETYRMQRRQQSLQATQQLGDLIRTSMLGYYTWPGGGTRTGEEIVAPPPVTAPPAGKTPYVEEPLRPYIEPPGFAPTPEPAPLPPDVSIAEPITETWSQHLQTGMKKASAEYRRKRAAKEALQEKLAAAYVPYDPLGYRSR